MRELQTKVGFHCDKGIGAFQPEFRVFRAGRINARLFHFRAVSKEKPGVSAGFRYSKG
jgi:hypothetical protein